MEVCFTKRHGIAILLEVGNHRNFTTNPAAITFKVKYALFQLAYITEYFRSAISKVTNRENGV